MMMDAGVCKPAPETGKIDLTNWGFADSGKPISAAEITDILRDEFEEHPPRLSFPFEWSMTGTDGRYGPSVTDPLMVYVNIPLGQTSDTHPEWAVSLRDVAMQVIDWHESDTEMREAFCSAFENLAVELRARFTAQTRD